MGRALHAEGNNTDAGVWNTNDTAWTVARLLRRVDARMATRDSWLVDSGLQCMDSDFYSARPKYDTENRATVDIVDCKLHPFPLTKITESMWRHLSKPNPLAQLEVYLSMLIGTGGRVFFCLTLMKSFDRFCERQRTRSSPKWVDACN